MTPTPRTSERLEALTPALARCVGDAERFLATGFTAVPHRWSGGTFDDLLSLEDVDRQLNGGGLRRPAIRLVRDGVVLDPATWTSRARTGAVCVDDLAHPGRTLGLFADGATLVLQSLQRWWPPLTRFCRELGETLGHRVQANAYLTPPGAAGLTPHHDTHDVFVLQVHGTKHWTVREPLVHAPLARHRSDHAAAAGQPVLFEATMTPGDCLYLPRGVIHSASAQDGVSLHITIGVLVMTVHDLLRRVVDRTADEPAFRRTLPVGFGADDAVAARVIKEAVGELVGWLEALDVDLMAGELVESVSRRPPELDGHLVELASLGAVGDATVVARRSRAPVPVITDGLRVQLRLGDRRVDLPASVEPALHRLLDGGRHAVGTLHDLLDESSRLVLVRRLIREGALRTTDGP